MRQEFKNDWPRYCPFCGHLLQDPEKEEEIRSCHICRNTYLVHPFQDKQYSGHEEWYDIPGFLGIYQVSSHLRVRSLDRISASGRRLSGRLMSTYPKKNELYVALCKNGRQREYNVQTLLSKAKQEKRRLGGQNAVNELRLSVN